MEKKKILAVGLNTPKEEKQIIKDKLSLDDVILDTASIKDLVFEVIKNQLKVTIHNRTFEKYDYVWIQSGWDTAHAAFLLDRYLRNINIPHNKTNSRQSKISDIFTLALNGIPIPNTFFQCGNLMPSKEKVAQIIATCGLPCIYKTYQGSKGSDVYLLQDEEELKKTLKEENGSFKFMFQQYIPNDFDYRVLIANNEPYSICRRVREAKEYRNNTALGATEEFLTVDNTPKIVRNIAMNSAKALKLKWAGVDIVTDTDTNENYVLEVNRRPGLTVSSTETAAAYRFIAKLAGI